MPPGCWPAVPARPPCSPSRASSRAPAPAGGSARAGTGYSPGRLPSTQPASPASAPRRAASPRRALGHGQAGRARPQGEVGRNQALPPGAGPSSRSWLRGPSKSCAAALPSGPVPSRWSPSRTYQPPSGSLADVPRRAEGPRDHSGTGVASSPTEPSKPESSSVEHTFTDASSRSATNFSSGFLPGCDFGLGQVFALAWPSLQWGATLSFGSRRGVDEREHQMEQVTHLAVTGQESLPP